MNLYLWGAWFTLFTSHTVFSVSNNRCHQAVSSVVGSQQHNTWLTRNVTGQRLRYVAIGMSCIRYDMNVTIEEIVRLLGRKQLLKGSVLRVSEEERRIGRKVEEHFRRKTFWKAVDIFWEQWIGQLSYQKKKCLSRKKLALDSKPLENFTASSTWEPVEILSRRTNENNMWRIAIYY